jgi:alpha-beta hydrolase superfamily lysophospholipase/SAM-dependent methyltransferase
MTLRLAEEQSFATHDGQSLFYRHWPVEADVPRRGAVILFHRGHEHSARMAHLVDELDLPGHAFFAWDARGHGLSPGERGYSPSAATSVRDIQTFVEHIRDTYGVAIEDMTVIGQSVGAVLAAAWAHDYAPPLRALVLASPAFRIKLYVPLALPGLRLMYRLRGRFFVNSYVKPKLLTHDPERIASYQSDPLIARAIAVNMLLDLHDMAKRVVADAAAITVPTQVLISGADWVVHRKPQDQFFERLSSTRKERIVLDGFHHDTLGELERGKALAQIRTFVLREYDAPQTPVSLLDAHQRGPFFDEYAGLKKSPPPLMAAYWALVRGGLRVTSLMSSGVALGFQRGFDSGSSLDYVYRNRAEGRSPLGKLIDRNYLDSIGWRGIRQRKINIEALIADAIARLQRAGQPVRIVDIAAGHGRYVLDAIANAARGRSNVEHILLRDYSKPNVDAGRALIIEKGFGAKARFEQADAFDADSLAALDPRPTLAIVSGLYELFSDNAPVRASLGGLAKAVAPGGYLVYTGQPWHPQLEFIARTLKNHRGEPAWVMRRRSQAELDQLVASAGFRKIAQQIDEWGIFTVSLAQRVSEQ